MPRPCKRRRICAKPSCVSFGPQRKNVDMPVSSDSVNIDYFPPIVMTLDEYETIRLIDLAGLTQEQCAEQMDVARTTVQAIYGSARGKLAECLVLGKELVIDGGNYVICDREAGGCGKGCRGGHRPAYHYCRHSISAQEYPEDSEKRN